MPQFSVSERGSWFWSTRRLRNYLVKSANIWSFNQFSLNSVRNVWRPTSTSALFLTESETWADEPRCRMVSEVGCSNKWQCSSGALHSDFTSLNLNSTQRDTMANWLIHLNIKGISSSTRCLFSDVQCAVTRFLLKLKKIMEVPRN